jgi:hypothetical protein
MDKRSGLIRPPQGLVDRLTVIGRGATAKYWLDREERERGQKCLDQEDVDGFEWVIEDIDDLCRNIRKGEVSLEDVKWAFQASLNTTKLILDKCASIGLTIPALTTERVILAQKRQEATLIFEDERSYRNELAGLVSRLEAILTKTLKTLVGESLFSDTMREQYLEASAQVEHNDQQSWVVSDSFLGEVRLNLIIKRTPTLGSYVYRGSQHTLLLYVHPGRIGFDLGEIRGVVRHELVHAMQKQISLNNEVSQAGLPRSKSGVYRQGMREKEKELKVEYARKGLDPEDVSIHALDDIEFYSRLLDEVVNFQRIMGSNPSNADIHNHISRRLFFKSLKRQPKKWRKAVGIFSSEVMSRNVRRASEFKTPRKWSKAHCESKSCDEMGFSEKASCRPYKNCYTPKKTSKRSHMNTYTDPSRVVARYKQASFDKEANLLNIIKSIFYDVPKSSFKGVSSELLLLSARLFKLHKGAIIKGCGATFESHVLSMLPLNIHITKNPLSRYQGVTIPTLVKFNPLDPMASLIKYGDFYVTDLHDMVDLNSDFMQYFFKDDIRAKAAWSRTTTNFYKAWANKYLAVLLKAQGKKATVNYSGSELDMSYKSLIGQMASTPAYIFAHLFRMLYYLPNNLGELVKETLYLLLVAFVTVLKSPFKLGGAISKLFEEKIKPLAVQG